MERIGKYILTIMTFTVLVVTCNTSSENPEIGRDELYRHLAYLASDSLKGRYPGTVEDSLAAAYLAGQFEKAGLDLLHDRGLQPFKVTTEQSYGPNNSLKINGSEAEPENDFIPFPFSSSDSLQANVVFAGFGFRIDDQNIQWNDYAGINPSGKWVMILRGYPGMDSTESVFVNYGNDRDKAMLGRDLGAGGMLFVSGKSYDPQDELVGLDSREFSVGIPVIHIKRSLADRMLRASGYSLQDLERKLLTERKPVSLESITTVSGAADLELVRKTTYNVIGYLEGKDPSLRDQYLVLGAHYDHLGLGGPGSSSRKLDTVAVHYGADDNASGVAAMLEIAEKLSLGGSSLPVSCLFIAFGAEEMGLLGSKYFMEHSLVDAENIRMMINLDMIGRLYDRPVQIGGTGTSLETDSLLDHLLGQDSIRASRSPEGYGPSDHATFYAADIPVLFFTSGPHEDYHTPEDHIDRIDMDGMKHIAELVYRTILTVGNRENALTFTEAGPKVRSPGRYGNNRITLGIMPDFMSADDYTGMRVDMVSPGRPAARAGMKKGDIILSIEGKQVNNVYDYMYRMSQVSYGQQIVVTVEREGGQINLLIQL